MPSGAGTRGGRQELLPGANPDAQKALKIHFDRLYERGWVAPTVAQDEALLAKLRAAVGRDSLAKRIYDRLKLEPTPDIRDFIVTEKAGPKAMLVFGRVSREPLSKGVPGFYTKDGYYKQFAKRLDATTLQLAQEEAWVLGTSGGAARGSHRKPRRQRGGEASVPGGLPPYLAPVRQRHRDRQGPRPRQDDRSGAHALRTRHAAQAAGEGHRA